MSKLKIFGKANPVVGKKEYYSIHDFFGSSNPASFDQLQFQNLSDEHLKWSIWVFNGSSWSKRAENNKTGTTVHYTFSQKSLTRKGIRMLVEANGEKAVLDIKTEKATQGKILHVDLLDNNYHKPTRTFAYGDWIIAKVHCVDMELLPVKVTLWEDDGDKTKQNTTNVRIETKISDILNGIAYAKFYLDPSHAWLANVKLAKGDKNEGEFHEYYVTAEIFEKISKRVASKNANIPNPDYKPEAQAPKKQTPAEKKGPSKKEQKGIAKSDNKVHDYHETKVSVKNEISTNPVWEKINSMMTVNMDPDWWKKKEDEEKGKCYCNRDITADELAKMVKNIRDNTFYDGKTITFFHSDKLFYLYSNVPKSDRTFEKFAEALNKAFKKYEITTCARKIHFIANMYVETMYFTATREGKGTSGFRYDPYRGRGFQHLTWEDNYKKYKKETGIDIVNDYEKVADDLSISADTGAWYWKKTGINEYADKDSIFDTSRLINYPGATKSSSINGYKEREIAWRELKKIFKFPFDCVSKKSINITLGNCPKCKVSHYDLSEKVEWQTQFDSKWGGIDAQNVACKKTCDDILNKQGLTSTSPTNKFQTALENSNHSLLVINTEESKRGIKYLDLQLKEGNPVQVGVDHALNYKGGKLNEGTTDHFVVIIGKSCDNGKVYYRFYDVGTRNKSKGTSSENRLYLDTSNYSLKGKTAYTNHSYTVTQIRNNKKR